MNIAFIIRFHYEENDPRFKWRFDYFKDEVLDRIKKQTVQNFDICIRCNPHHKKLFEDLGLKTFQVSDEFVKYKVNKNNPRKKYFHDFVSWERVIGLPKYDIQIGLDSDDLISPFFVEKIIKTIVDKKDGTKSMHICFQPQYYHLKSNKVSDMRVYSENTGSAFMALYQPNKKDYRFIYEESHMTIIRRADIKVVISQKGFCWATCHDINESTGK